MCHKESKGQGRSTEVLRIGPYSRQHKKWSTRLDILVRTKERVESVSVSETEDLFVMDSRGSMIEREADMWSKTRERILPQRGVVFLFGVESHHLKGETVARVH